MKKRFFPLLLALTLLLALCTPFALAEGRVLSITSASGRAGETVSIQVYLTGSASGGRLELAYDPAELELCQWTGADGAMCFFNHEQPGLLIMTFASTGALENTSLCTLEFRVSAATPESGSALTLKSFRLYDENGDSVPATAEKGCISRSTARLTLSREQTAERQSVRMAVRLEGELSPAGGNFTLQYDPDCLRLTSVLKLHPSVELLTWNESELGTVRVSFSSTQPLSAGELCAAMFRTVGTAGDTSAVTLTDVRMYDTDGKTIDASAKDGSVDVVLPSDRAPKLWAVGGAIQPDGSAVVSVVLQGRGVVCGGSFTLTYDQSLSVQAEASGSCQINAEPGRIRASFASATPVADQITLFKLTIQNAVPGAIDLSDVILRDDSGSRIAVTDIRPTTLSRTSSAAAFAGTLQADTTGGQTQYLLDVDVSDMHAGTPKARTAFTCLLVLYNSEGQLEGLSIQKIAASDSGVNELTLAASVSESPAYAKVFLLSDVSAGLPLCGALQAALDRG